MNIFQIILNKIELQKVRSKLVSLNNKYFTSVDNNWKSNGFSNTGTCFPNECFTMSHNCKVSFLKGIDLVLANNKDEKHILLSDLPIEVKFLVRKYVRLRGFSDEFVRSYEDFHLSD